jgi:hypothetical protein
VATYWTEVATVELLVGALTHTPAKADVVRDATIRRGKPYSLILGILQLFLYSELPGSLPGHLLCLKVIRE